MIFSRRKFLLAAASGLGLAGCGYKPLYRKQEAGGASVSEALKFVSIIEPRDRLGQLIRNDLISDFGQYGQGERRYELSVVHTFEDIEEFGTRSFRARRRTVLVNASYALKNIRTNAQMTAGTSFARVSYENTGLEFADEQAQTNAMERCAKVIADDITTRLGGYFSKNHP